MSIITIFTVVICRDCGCIATYKSSQRADGSLVCVSCHSLKLNGISPRNYVAETPSDLPHEFWQDVALCDKYTEIEDGFILYVGDSSEILIHWKTTDVSLAKIFLSQLKIRTVNKPKADGTNV